jgi:hypothetical protein
VPWPGGESSPKAADLPAHDHGDQEAPALPLPPHPGPAAAYPPEIATTGSGAEAGQESAATAGLDARYEQLRHAVLHDRARAFPLGLGVLIARGVTAWRRLLAGITATPTPACATTTAATGTLPAPQGRPQPAPTSSPPPVPAVLTSQLVHVLADLAVTLAGD